MVNFFQKGANSSFTWILFLEGDGTTSTELSPLKVYQSQYITLIWSLPYLMAMMMMMSRFTDASTHERHLRQNIEDLAVNTINIVIECNENIRTFTSAKH